MSKGGSSSSSRWSRCMRAPVRLLCCIRDTYVRGMTACAGKVGQYRGAGVAYYPSFSDFAYGDCSFSSSSRRSDVDLDLDEDLRELIRAASRARREEKSADVRRSQSVVVGRIDEDRPCEFEEEVKVGSSLIFPRRSSSTSSHGVGTKKRGHKADVFAC